MTTQLQESLEKYAQGFRSLVAFLCEARIRQYATEQVDFFVEGFEGGRNDCAIYAGPGTLQTKEGTANTLFVQLPKHHQGKKVLGPLDIKRCTARCDSKQGVQFTVKISPDQRLCCQTLILVSPKEPDFVALVPFHYLPLRDTEVAVEVYFRPIRPL